MDEFIGITFSLRLMCCFLFLHCHSATAQSTVGRRLDSLFTVYSDSGFSGSVLVAEKGTVTLKKGYGYANSDSKNLNTPATLFNVASLGKQFTAYSILYLEKQGKLSTSDYVSKYIGPFNDLRDSTTIHHLLLHSSGLFKEGNTLDYNTRSGFIRAVKAGGMESSPGSQYRYSNAGYSLLAGIVEIVSGQPFEVFLLHNVFGPANMKNTGYPWEARMRRELFATGYDKNKKPVESQPNIWAARGPGNLMTSVEDLYQWTIALQSERFMPDSMRQKIFHDYIPGKETYSWHKETTSRNTRFYYKGGGRSDFETQLMWYPDEGIVVIFCINNDYNLRGRLFTKIKMLMN